MPHVAVRIAAYYLASLESGMTTCIVELISSTDPRCCVSDQPGFPELRWLIRHRHVDCGVSQQLLLTFRSSTV